MVEYSKRLSEVDDILNYLPKQYLLRIPEDIRQFIKDNKDQNYNWKYDKSKTLNQQNLCRDTMIILSFLNMEYLLSEEQKNLMQQIHELNGKHMEFSKIDEGVVENVFTINQEK